ncbi:acetyltransferase GNAT family [Vibrio maritimus]|uniref:Acetyltransferase GNAT family n=1 Tax=Vibrio maritimus TaxID=990268 RepID=A0A090T313_9VIBR|nr:acetyltransferase GNAT family [Vibrio maritimus]
MEIVKDDLQGHQIKALLQEHLDDMYATSPAESVHALDIEALRKSNIEFWTAWNEQELLGCIALKALDSEHAEIKSMRTSHNARGKGVAKRLLNHLVSQASDRGFSRLSLETGTEDYFTAARTLYSGHGFVECDPFADYVLDPNSVFMTRQL